MSKPTLKLAAKPRVRTGPPLSLVKRAIRLFRGRGVPKATYRANALKWLAMHAWLGDRHILNRAAPAKWGQPGESRVKQVFAPRRLNNGGA